MARSRLISGGGAAPHGAYEVPIHRLVAADVAHAGTEKPRPPPAPRHHEQAVALEGDDAIAPEELRQPEPPQQRGHLARVIQRTHRPIIVAERDHHALGAPVRPLARHRGPVALNESDPGAQAACQVQPVDAFLEERVAAGHRLVVAPVSRRLELLDQRGEVAEHHLADDALGHQPAQGDGQGLVVVVLAHEHDASRAVSGLERLLVLVHPQERGLLDDHVLAGGEGPQGQFQMESRRDRHDHGVHARVVDGRVVARIAGGATEASTELRGLGLIAARIRARDVSPQPSQMAAVHPGDEAASEEGDAERFGHGGHQAD